MSEEQKKSVTSKKKCFIITPIGEDGSETFRMAKGVIESVIKPILRKNGFGDIKPAYEILESGMIGNQIVDRIVNDDLVIANLTGNNPNVMYELAIRHAAAKPIIHICEFGTKLPFDIKDNRTIFYKNDMLGTKELMEGLDRFVKTVDYGKEYMDNPIYNGIQTGRILRDLDESGKGSEAQLLQQIIDLLSKKNLKEDELFFSRRHLNTMPDMILEVKRSSDDMNSLDFINNLNTYSSEFKIRQIAYFENIYKVFLDVKGSERAAQNTISTLANNSNVEVEIKYAH